MALADIRDMGRHTTETCINLRPSPTNRGSYVLYLFDSHFTVQLSTWQMPVTLIRVGTSQQTVGAAQRSGTFLVLSPVRKLFAQPGRRDETRVMRHISLFWIS